ncbi:uncharacterized protein LOC121261343 [Juglans microcarpa x Juglans regia]|uniref:uncharacterized protein LOC121261343 n=1 Tax=Juglans microcarpa x Juglans regia TaxID=2249226 RepID=UPI001B7EC43A|nr:uncharacterized protein LOC121261343 [Juglans microcarpa x Juglans regia]
MDRMPNTVTINAGLILGHRVTQQNPDYSRVNNVISSILPFVDVKFLVDVHIRAFEDRSTCGRYFYFSGIANSEIEAIKLAQSLSPLISLPPRYECQGREVYAERLRTKKLNKLFEGITTR